VGRNLEEEFGCVLERQQVNVCNCLLTAVDLEMLQIQE
jgi:hypothetical protein